MIGIKSYRAVQPVSPAARYIGGKRNLAQRLAERIERIPHERYVEPFVGMGGVFFSRRHAPRVEVINDLPETRKLFSGFKSERVATTYSSAAYRGPQKAFELVVKGP